MSQLNQGEEVEQINSELLKSNIAVYTRPSRVRSIWQLVNSLAPFGLLWVAAWYALQYSFWLMLPLTLLASGFLVRIFIIFHDCGHQSFFRSRKANNFWGTITGVITFTPYYYWSINHAKHHETSGNLDQRGFGDVWTMTVAEYARAPRLERLKYRLYRHPLVMLLLGPLLITIVTNRFLNRKANRLESLSVYATDLALILIGIGLSLVMGLKSYLIIQSLVLFVGLIGGIWLFYVQHQFEGVYWARENEWDFISASLKGGSFYKLPKVLMWFSGNIGYHHVHHLMTTIPNYNLPKCHEGVKVMNAIQPTDFRTSLKSLSYRLWDEESRQLVGFKKVKEYRQRNSAQVRNSMTI